MRTLILLAGACLTVARLGSAQPTVACYYSSTSGQRHGAREFQIQDLAPSVNKCTQLIFGSAYIGPNYNVMASQDAEAKFPTFNSLGSATLKTILEVNLMLRPTIVQDMLVNDTPRQTFITTAISYLRTHGFDGINLMWLNANNCQVTKSDYTSFVQEFRAKIDEDSSSTGQDALLLTASVASRIVDIERSYDVVPVATAVDFLNVMTSDTTAYFARETPSFQTPGASLESASRAMKYWKMEGALPGKLNMGIGVFGRVFTLDPSGQVEPVKGSLSDLPAGMWSRYEVCSSSAPAHIWFAFDNQADIDAKVQFIQNEGLAGAFVVSMDLDDFDGNSCTDTNDLHGPFAVTDRVHSQLNPPVQSND